MTKEERNAIRGLLAAIESDISAMHSLLDEYAEADDIVKQLSWPASTLLP